MGHLSGPGALFLTSICSEIGPRSRSGRARHVLGAPSNDGLLERLSSLPLANWPSVGNRY